MVVMSKVECNCGDVFEKYECQYDCLVERKKFVSREICSERDR